ncbi:MAG: type III-A CRISPR-associated RAMP protein Csm4 [Chloroflexi bacterium]|nr:type III-A CRISPR-associated RAMP protein Csm4 [Chloroflexota bacterium]
MQDYLLRLDPLSPMHVGEPGIGLENCSQYIPSDTLFGALCNAWAILHGSKDLEELLGSFPTKDSEKLQSPIVLSSAFPRFKKNGIDYFFFPKPFSPPPPFGSSGDPDEEEIGRKIGNTLKEIPFVEKAIFKNWAGHLPLSGLGSLNDFEKHALLVKEAYQTNLLARVRLDRITRQSQIYFVKSLNFTGNGGGLFCLVQLDDSLKDRFESAFRFLGDQGIGGERSLGFGRFCPSKMEPVPGDFLLGSEDSGSHHLTLSMYHPSETELGSIQKKPRQVYYDLVQRGGWVDSPHTHSPHRKNRCFMFREGSAFPFPPRGVLCDVTPDGMSHRVYRYGIPYTYRIRLTE